MVPWAIIELGEDAGILVQPSLWYTTYCLQRGKVLLSYQGSLTPCLLPVTLQSQILLSELWEKGLGWDEQVHMSFHPGGIAFHLTSFNWGPFPSHKGPSVRIRLVTFSFFMMHHLRHMGSLPMSLRATNLACLLPRLRWHPWKEKLLAAYLALKCLHTVLNGCGGFKPAIIHVATDSQVVLLDSLSVQC